MIAKEIIDGAAEMLLDESNVRWSRTALLRYLNAGQNALAAIKSDVCTDTIQFALADGVRQKLPLPALRVLDVIRNTEGPAITLVSRVVMTDLRATWMQGRAGRAIEHYCADESAPLEFLVYPPAKAGMSVDVQRARLPERCGNENSTLGVSDIFEVPLIDYVCHRAYMRDSESPGSAAKAAAHYQSFVAAVTGKANNDAKAKPQSLYPAKVAPSTQ